MKTQVKTLIDGSKLTIEALARAGAEVFIGYPITPSNLMYSYSKVRMPYFLAAPDEITTMQWMSGLSATGKLPVTSSAFPGLALMTESINMAYAMELPMVIILTQRLGPSTGSATTGAQGDLQFLNGIISGGYPLPVLSPTNFEDIWKLAAKAVEVAVKYRTPVIFLTSKEMIMTQKSFDLSLLDEIRPLQVKYEPRDDFKPYEPVKKLTPAHVWLGNDRYLTRITASTHDAEGTIRKNEPEAMENTKRLQEKLEKNLDDFLFLDWKHEKELSPNLIVSWGITAEAVRDAQEELKEKGIKADILFVKTLLPVSEKIYEVLSRYDRIVFAEENLNGQLKEILFGKRTIPNVKQVNKIGNMITPAEIVQALQI